jgi:8-oxo-dGTP diphosphatase
MTGNDLQLRPELAAGGLVWRRSDDGLEVLVVHRPKYADWSLPKGRLDDGESLLECALREVEEETGLVCNVGRKLPQVVYVKPGGRNKKVALWAMSVVDGQFTPNREVDKIKWVPIGKAAKRLTYPGDAQMLDSLGKRWTEHPRRVLLVRHAHAGDRHRWDHEDDAKRPLSTKGQRQAQGLAQMLQRFDVDRAFSSPAVRCVDTIKQVIKARGHKVQINDVLWEDTPIPDVTDFVLNAKRGTTVLSSHGPIIAGVLRNLLDTRRTFPHEKGSTWVLDLRKGGVIDANYLAPRG